MAENVNSQVVKWMKKAKDLISTSREYLARWSTNAGREIVAAKEGSFFINGQRLAATFQPIIWHGVCLNSASDLHK
jgi:hypothetical protein